MKTTLSTAARFRAARTQAGLSIAQTATRTGVSEASVWDLETYDDELMTTCSPARLLRFAEVFGVAPGELLGTEAHRDPVSASELASLIREHCRTSGISLDAFGDAAGWDVSKAADVPHLLLSDFPLDGIRDICQLLRIDWQRFVSGLTSDTFKNHTR
jgi:transcriptional regulator with XRE-family HTH domain